MHRESRVVRLRGSGLKAVITIFSEADATYFASYIYTPNDHGFKVQVLFSFCENYLVDIIPAVARMAKPERKKVFDELYEAIKELNPTIGRVTAPRKGTPSATVTLQMSQQGKPAKVKVPPVTKHQAAGIKKAISKSIYGQDAALEAIQDLFLCSFAGLSDEKRPRGSFIFVGDTGTGKTAVVEELAKYFWADKWRDGLFRINGSEFMSSHETSKLLGAPHGYVGFEEGSPMLKHMAENPESIVLVDEFEKAHQRLQDVFLQILDEGECFDNKGNRIDFSKSFVIFTSNIGTREVYHENPLGFAPQTKKKDDVQRSVKSALLDFCRIEFLKRFDGVVIFDQLEDDTLEKIVHKCVRDLNEKMKSKCIHMEYENKAKLVSHVLENLEGLSARDIQHVFRDEVTKKVAHLLAREEDYLHITVKVEDGEVLVSGRRD